MRPGCVAFEGRGNSLSKPVFPQPPVSLTTNNMAKNLKLIRGEHACSTASTGVRKLVMDVFRSREQCVYSHLHKRLLFFGKSKKQVDGIADAKTKPQDETEEQKGCKSTTRSDHTSLQVDHQME